MDTTALNGLKQLILVELESGAVLRNVRDLASMFDVSSSDIAHALYGVDCFAIMNGFELWIADRERCVNKLSFANTLIPSSDRMTIEPIIKHYIRSNTVDRESLFQLERFRPTVTQESVLEIFDLIVATLLNECGVVADIKRVYLLDHEDANFCEKMSLGEAHPFLFSSSLEMDTVYGFEAHVDISAFISERICDVYVQNMCAVALLAWFGRYDRAAACLHRTPSDTAIPLLHGYVFDGITFDTIGGSIRDYPGEWVRNDNDDDDEEGADDDECEESENRTELPDGEEAIIGFNQFF